MKIKSSIYSRGLCVTFAFIGLLLANSSGSASECKAQLVNDRTLSYSVVPSQGNQMENSAGALDTLRLAGAREKLVLLKKTVSEAKLKGISTGYEDITIRTASLFLDKYIPWDIAHPTELASAFSHWSKKEDLKGTPQQEAVRAPEWELNQTSEILDKAQLNIESVLRKPESRRAVPEINVNHLTIADGFLSSDGKPAFSGGFIWAPEEMDHSYFGLIGGEASIAFGSLQSDGTISENVINRLKNKLDGLQAIGQKGSIGFGQSVPAWAVTQWPDLDDFKGHFFSYDIDHPQVRTLWKNFISALVPQVRNHPAKFDYQLAIEPIWPSVGNWMVNNASPYTFQKYQSWLGDLYGNISNLNASWGTSFTSFGEITSRPADNSNPSLWYDWCRFNEWRVTDFFKFISDEIHKYDPDARCHMRISVGGINYLDSGTKAYSGLHNGIDREALVHNYEINGLDNFMQAVTGRVDEQLRYYEKYNEKAYSLRWLGHTVLLDFIRSLGPDKLIYDSEWHSVSSVYYVNPEPPAGYMHTALWLSALHGLGATRTWYWCRNANGSVGRSPEEFYGSLLVQPRLLNEYGVGLAELNAFGKEVVALEKAPKQIYLLYSESSGIQSTLYLGNQMLTYEALQFTGLPVGFVTENELGKTGLPLTCKWLIIPGDSYVSQTTLDKLHDYIKGGGKLLVTGSNSLKFNEHGKAYSPSQLEFMSGVVKLDSNVPTELLGKLETEMARTEVKRSVRCIENSGKTAYGVLCRSVEYEGGHLICLINVDASEKEVSLELNGKTVKSCLDLFENKSVSTKNIKMATMTVRLLNISK